MIELLMRAIRWLGCTTGICHLRCMWDDDGITCIDCGHFKSKYEHLADLNAGGGW
jgi:hypothetical protein